MKEIKTKQLTGIPIIDKHLTAGKSYEDDITTKNGETFYIYFLIERQYPDKAKIFIDYYGHENMLKSTNVDILKFLVKNGYGLSELVNHPSLHVRAAVADKGYGLEQLAKDQTDMYVHELLLKVINQKNSFMMNRHLSDLK